MNSGNYWLSILRFERTYGLLGASGCGKTTLLSCIVGRRRLNTGEIWVLGGKPGTKGSGVPGKRVGYMPQEIALYGEFTIKETMMYFGWIFGMESKEIYERLQFLLNFLDLPSQNRMVKNLRRVSFAVALMHDPELLILDEPTVGVDPLLRQSIWNHLVQITKDGNKTVIITTHYIEEARQAHTIGLMRSGKLLAEESPHVLLSMYGCTSLEEVFLKLSRKQVQVGAAQPDQNISNNISLATLNWAKKDSISVTEESGVVGLNFHQSKEVLVTDSNGHLDECGYEKGCKFSNLSCRYLETLNTSTMVKQYYPDQDAAREAVKSGDAWGALYFTENFTDALVARMALGKDAEKETLEQSEVRVWLDMSNQQIGIILQRDLQLAYQNFTKDILRDCDHNEDLAEIPISIVFFLAVALTSSALIIERMEGLLDRSWVAGK
ncbi:hypothetical protein NQ314_004298 [Rhamnusium bicolor]|uniref:ABC transporter domain-containing protein n=1 Tax=Rhamnusium bicolor TaxID=1586634 RepID=A0AAV8ZLI9_9CUCU|nr:hypothetical protein NQ314_004298 [Rhamnusium bicolor]